MDGNTVHNTPPDPYNCLLNTTLLLTSCTVQSLSVQAFLAKHKEGLVLRPSFETLVTAMISTELPTWTTDFCFLYFYCVEKVYVTISDTYSDILQKQTGKRKRVYLEGLGLTPYKPLTKETKEVNDMDTYKVTVKYPSSINLSSFIKNPYILF